MDEAKDITAALSNILETHGYGFQYAVLAAAERLFKPGGGSPWRHPVAEFPIEINRVLAATVQNRNAATPGWRGSAWDDRGGRA
jgi:hypothetical protein